MNKKELGFECERAISFLVKYMNNEGWKKPALFHSIRVGTHLYESGYERDVVIGGFLHDVLEDGLDITEEILEKEFGREVLLIMKANSKDETIEDKQAQKEDLIRRCILEGEKASIVKSADLLDNFFYYELTSNKKELTGHCSKYASLMIEKLPEDFNDIIFRVLKERLIDIQKNDALNAKSSI